ncbi:GGDEF domain-containing protein [Jiangella endophytica]|uniref:GGDEF domain-containing protein n=1 Tax=Jiangella endophytica TaxID=1623398 RepID=UPI0018E5A495|nr:GGDEF domain-containing protein [Jiangella endophytica]
MLTVDAIAVLVSIATAFLVPVHGVDVLRFAVLALCAAVAIELTRQFESRREYARTSTVPYIDTKAVWSFAAVVVLPPVLATAMVVFTYTLAWFRVQPNRQKLPYRWIFSSATVLCGTHAAVAVLAVGMAGYPRAPGEATWVGLMDLGIVACAAVVRWAINLGLIMTAIALSKPTVTARELFANFGEQLLEAGAIGLGLVAAAVVVTNPFVLPGIVIAMIALHRGILLSQYQEASRVDSKTGLTTAGWWHDFAERSLARARDRDETLGLLIVDLDHFKNINDTHGHPYGDSVLKAVARELMAEIRDNDACGRWGGEEFVVVLPDVGTQQNLHNVAERIRRRVQSIVVQPPGQDLPAAEIGITASVGGAIFPSAGITSIDELLLAADTALYAAKNSGRNTVRLGGSDVPALPKQRALPQQAEPPNARG